MRSILFAVCCLFIGCVQSLENGVARTPPMGWSSWQRYRCITDCEKYPDECISDRLIRKTANTMVRNGYLASGYEYIIIDDCWLDEKRSLSGKLQENRSRFPYGMQSLIEYVHSKGLKFGIYEDYGNKTCSGYPGLYGNEEMDLNLLASWGIDYIKIDGCNYNNMDFVEVYGNLRDVLNATGRSIVFSCEYPFYAFQSGIPVNYSLIPEICNVWRNYNHIDDSWESVTSVLDYHALKQDYIAQYAGPGSWNDPDMLLIGNYGLSYDQSRVQMALWSILAAPLLMSVDLQHIKPEYADILKNENIIAINQDKFGKQGLRVLKRNLIEVWTRKVSPYVHNNYSFAIAIYSRRVDGFPIEFNVTLSEIGLDSTNGYVLEDLYGEIELVGNYYPYSELSVRVNPAGVVFLKATAQ